MFYSIGIFLIVITLIVFVHEGGHYVLARRFGVGVRTFSVGFGPPLLSWVRGGTRFCLSLVPLGGYVRMEGWTREELEALPASSRGTAFLGKSLFARTCIVAAGPAANFVLAIVLFTGLYMSVGAPQRDEGQGVVLGEVVVGSPAEAAGLRAGDRLLSLRGRPVSEFSELVAGVQQSEGEAIELEVLRPPRGELLTLSVKAQADEQGRYVIGVILRSLPSQRLSVLPALLRATEMTFETTLNIVVAVYELIAGRRSLDELGGPVRLAQISGDAARAGVVQLVFFTALLSINLGLLNLFPIPILDGGYLLLYGIETLRGKPLGERVEGWLFSAGFAFLILLMVWVTGQDVLRLLGF